MVLNFSNSVAHISINGRKFNINTKVIFCLQCAMKPCLVNSELYCNNTSPFEKSTPRMVTKKSFLMDASKIFHAESILASKLWKLLHAATLSPSLRRGVEKMYRFCPSKIFVPNVLASGCLQFYTSIVHMFLETFCEGCRRNSSNMGYLKFRPTIRFWSMIFRAKLVNFSVSVRKKSTKLLGAYMYSQANHYCI